MFFAHKKNERAIVMQQVRKEEKVKGKRSIPVLSQWEDPKVETH